MTKPIYLDWENNSKIAPPFPFELSLEKEATYDEVYKASNWKKKILMRLVKLFGYTPQLAFQKEDVNMEIVEQMLKRKDLLGVIDSWISDTDYNLLPKLREAKEVFEKIQTPPRHQHLYRGFNINPGQQNSGIADRYKKMQPGDKWSFTPDKPISFSWHEGTTSAYGSIIVSVDFAKVSKRCLHITHEMVMAMFKLDDFEPGEDLHMFTYAECVFLPDNQPIEFTLVKKS